MKPKINDINQNERAATRNPICFLVCMLLAFTLSNTYAAQPLGCLIEPERIAAVGSPVVGVVESINVERGDFVRKGQVLATLRADVERASLQVANTRSQAEAEVHSAEAALKLAHVTEKREQDLVRRKFISQQALDKSHAETLIAEQQLALAREQLRTWNSELSLARAQLSQRTIRSPIDGIIAERYIWPGERVEEKPMFRVAKISPLRVEMVLSAAHYGTVSKGMQISVVPLLPNAQPMEAKVTLVDKLIDSASNTYRIRAEIPNKDSAIPSGLRCKVELPDPVSVAAANTSGAEPASDANIADTMITLPRKSQVDKPGSTNIAKVKKEPSVKFSGEVKSIIHQPVR